MIIGERIRRLREAKQMSQGDIEERTGLLRCYISRVENGHAIPAITTLEKMARALGVPLHHLLYDGEQPPKPQKRGSRHDTLWGHSGKEARFLAKLQRFLGRVEDHDRKLLMTMAQKMATRRRGRKASAEDAPRASGG